MRIWEKEGCGEKRGSLFIARRPSLSSSFTQENGRRWRKRLLKFSGVCFSSFPPSPPSFLLFLPSIIALRQPTRVALRFAAGGGGISCQNQALLPVSFSSFSLLPPFPSLKERERGNVDAFLGQEPRWLFFCSACLFSSSSSFLHATQSTRRRVGGGSPFPLLLLSPPPASQTGAPGKKEKKEGGRERSSKIEFDWRWAENREKEGGGGKTRIR